jgi:L-threonylcarbamoyladenylate synthase
VPDEVTAGRPLVAVRMPAHPVARALIEAAGVPIAAPSANRFGRPSPTSATHVKADLDGRIDAILDGGETQVGVESTVLDTTQPKPMILRPGGVSREALESVLGEVAMYTPPAEAEATPPESQPAPGLGVRHYAPEALLELVRRRDAAARLAELTAATNAGGGHLLRVGPLGRLGGPGAPPLSGTKVA